MSDIVNTSFKERSRTDEKLTYNDEHVHASNAILPGEQRPRVHGCLSCAKFLRSHCLGVKRGNGFFIA
jgi:hypothetical protein